MFIHGGVFHLLGNMFTLWAFACSLEMGLGSGCLLAFYVVWGLLAGFSHAMMDWDSTVPGIGASGAIAGLLGAYAVAYGPFAKIRTLIFIALRPMKVDIPVSVFGMGWFFYNSGKRRTTWRARPASPGTRTSAVSRPDRSRCCA